MISPLLRRSLWALCALSAIACDSGGGDSDAQNTFPIEGDPFPSATIERCDGTTLDLAAFIADHDVNYIAFGAQWCGPCREEVPVLKRELVEPLDGLSVGVTQILVEAQPTVPPSLAVCNAWVDELEPVFDTFVDLDQETVAQHFGNAIQTLPLHFIVTRDGTIRLRLLGELPSDIQQRVRDWLP